MENNVIKEFLIGLGFKENKAALAKFVGVVETVARKVTKIGASIIVAESAAAAFVTVAARNFEKLYYLSDKTKESAQNILGLGYAMSRVGSSTEEAESTLESFAAFLRNTPNAKPFLQSRLGIDPNSPPAEMLEQAGKAFKRFLDSGKGYLAKAYADVLGISENAMFALSRGGLKAASDKLENFYKRAGINAETAAEAGRDFGNEIRDLTAVLGVLWDKLTIAGMDPQANYIRKIREYIEENYDKIVSTVQWAINKIADIFNWFGTALEAAKNGKFFEWIKGQFKQVMQWLGQLWAKHGSFVVEVFSSAFGLIKVEAFKVFDDIANYLSDKIDNAIRSRFEGEPKWIQKALASVGMAPDTGGRIDEELRNIEDKENQDNISKAKDRFKKSVEKWWDDVDKTLSGSTEEITTTPVEQTPDRPMPGKKDYKARAAKVMKFFIEKGLTEQQAAGITGSLAFESVGLNERAVNSIGATGLAQWLGVRKKGIAEWGKTFDSQLQHIWDELQGDERLSLAAIKRTSNIQDAARVWTEKYERPEKSGYHLESRYNYAERALGAYRESVSEKPVTINQKTEIHVSGQVAPERIAAQQDRVNAQMARHLKVAVR